MGLLDKFKNMFTEEVDEDDVVIEKKEKVKKEKIESKPIQVVKQKIEPEKQTTPTRTTPITSEEPTKLKPNIDVDVDNYDSLKVEPVIKHGEKNFDYDEEKNSFLKREEKFVFPVYFDDNDFEKINEKKTEKVVQERKQTPEPVKKEVYGTKIEKKEEPKVFKPTPIISPIYGVLDKNYHKDDIAAKKIIHTEYRDPSKPLTIDEVRKKAYGSLEDDIEATLLAKSSIFMEPDETAIEEESKNNLLTDLVENVNQDESVENEYNSIDEFLNSPIDEYEAKHSPDSNNDNEADLNVEDELDQTLIDSINNKDKKKKSKTSRSEKNALDELLNNENYNLEDNLLEEYMNKKEENVETNDEDEDLTQSDLFNLIDSMYEKGEDE